MFVAWWKYAQQHEDAVGVLGPLFACWTFSLFGFLFVIVVPLRVRVVAAWQVPDLAFSGEGGDAADGVGRV